LYVFEMATALRDIESSYMLAEFGTSNIKYAGGDSAVGTT